MLIPNWRGTIVALLVALVVLFFAIGFWWPYWRVGDMDMWMVYEGFLLNDGLRQEYFDHPGYLTILLLWQWFKLLHAIGLLPIHALSELPPVADVAASGLAWMRATQAARALSLMIGMGFVTSFAFLLRRLVDDWRIAALAAFMLMFSGGFMMESRIIRTELIAAAFAYSALLILLICACRVSSGMRPLLIGFAALLATLAMLNKVQIIFLLGVMPPIVFVFGRHIDETNSLWQRRASAGTMAIASIAIAAVLVWLAWPIARAGLFDAEVIRRRTQIFGTGFPAYQAAIALWVMAWMAAYAVRFRVDALETLSAFAAVASGIALGLLVLALRYDIQNVVAVMNPLELMLAFASGSHSGLVKGGAVSGAAALHVLLSDIGLLLARFTFVLSSSPRPTTFLEWAVIAATIFAWRRGERKTVFQVAILLVAAAAIDLVGTVRGLKLEYFIITDPLVIIAAAWLLARVPHLQYHRLTYPIGLSLMIATVAVGLAEPVKHTFKRDKPLDFCMPHYPQTKRIERFSYCP